MKTVNSIHLNVYACVLKWSGIAFLTLNFLLVSSMIYASEKRVALLIGNSDYQKQPLTHSRNDIRDIAKALRQWGFQVTLKNNLTKKETASVVRAFNQTAKNATVSLFYYSGHGLQFEGKNYLLPLGTKINKENDLVHQANNFDEILSQIYSNKKQLKIMILDSCFTNTIPDNLQQLQCGLNVMDSAPDDLLVAYSSAPFQKIKNNATQSVKNSPFVRHLIKQMSIANKPVELVFKQVRKLVKQETKGQQIPWISSAIEDDFYFTTTGVPENTNTWQEPVSGISMIKVKPGCFMMGSPVRERGRKENEKRHRVCIKKSFWMGQYEVTQRQWQGVLHNNPSKNIRCGGNCPVENMKWPRVAVFIRQLNKKTGLNFRLPTEAEWEYVARAGTNGPYSFGSDTSKLSQYANFCDINCRNKRSEMKMNDGYNASAPVGSFKANPWGFYDMHGNVWEFSSDMYVEDYLKPDSQLGYSKKNSKLKTTRGGSWFDDPEQLRSAYRVFFPRKWHDGDIGFRLVLDD